MIETRFFLDAADGHRIETLAWSSGHPARAIVQLAHGMAEHTRRYLHVIHALVEAGYTVYANEHRGHGQAAKDRGELGDFGPAGFQSLPDDMATLTRHVRAQHPGLPVILLAHSMGSFAAQVYLLDHAGLVDGVALSGSAAIELLDVRVSGWTVESANASVDNPVTPADWLSRDPAVAPAFLSDPLCAFSLTHASLISIFDVGNRTAVPGQLEQIRKDLPLYLFTGDRDPVNHHLAWWTPLVQRLRQAGFTQLSTRVYSGARHEVLNETNRAEVIANLIAWIDRVIPQSLDRKPYAD